MDLLNLILSCSLTLTFDDQLIESIIHVESFKNASYIRSEGSQYGVGYGHQEEAKKAILEITNHGNEAYIGLMGLPYQDAKDNGYTLEQMLDHCGNIQIGTAMIDLYHDQCKAEGKLDLATCTIKKYARYTGQKTRKFTDQVMHSGLQKAEKKAQSESVFIELDAENNSVFIDLNDEISDAKSKE